MLTPDTTRHIYTSGIQSTNELNSHYEDRKPIWPVYVIILYLIDNEVKTFVFHHNLFNCNIYNSICFLKS